MREEHPAVSRDIPLNWCEDRWSFGGTRVYWRVAEVTYLSLGSDTLFPGELITMWNTPWVAINWLVDGVRKSFNFAQISLFVCSACLTFAYKPYLGMTTEMSGRIDRLVLP